jgi:outer membrane protein assembly factor BamB
VPSLPDRLVGQPDVVWSIFTSGDGLAGVVATHELVFIADRDLTDTKDVFRCLDAESGLELWTLEYEARGNLDYGNSPRAAPLFDGERAYFQGAFGHLHCIDVGTGEIVWKKDYLADFGGEIPIWGFCASPLLVDGKLIITPGGPEAFLAALDPKTGDVIWTTPGREPAYCSFICAELGGHTQLVGYDKTTLGGWELATGERLWELIPEWTGDFNVPTPVAVGEQLLVTTENNGTRLFDFGDDGRIIPQPVARHLELASDSSTPVVVSGRVFGVWGELFCLALDDSLATIWTSDDAAFRNYASLIASNDRVLVTTTDGEILLFDAAGDECTLLGRQQLFTDGSEVHSHPALVGNRLFVRSRTMLVCVELPAGE